MIGAARGFSTVFEVRGSHRGRTLLRSTRGGTLAVVGESHRQETLAKVARIASTADPFLPDLKGMARGVARRETEPRWFRAALLREPDNQYDPHAVAVHAAGVGHVGYLDRDAAQDYGPVFEELARQGYAAGTCHAFLTVGTEGNRGASSYASRRPTLYLATSVHPRTPTDSPTCPPASTALKSKWAMTSW